MAGTRFVWPNTFSVGADGIPRVGAKLAFFATGTDTPQQTYSDPALTIPNRNPVIADALGQFNNIFLLLSPQYKVVLSDANDVQIFTMDPCGPIVEIGGTVPVGAMMAFGGLVAPAGWLLCYGQPISRTIYAELFAVIGTAYGIGDGSSTFNAPDKRGRVSAGCDDMGGSPAGRLSAGVSGVDGLTVGASGGDQHAQNDTLTAISTAVSTASGGSVAVDANTISVLAGPNVEIVQQPGVTKTYPVTGVAVATSVTTSVSSLLVGASQNVQPTEVDTWIIFANA